MQNQPNSSAANLAIPAKSMTTIGRGVQHLKTEPHQPIQQTHLIGESYLQHHVPQNSDPISTIHVMRYPIPELKSLTHLTATNA